MTNARSRRLLGVSAKVAISLSALWIAFRGAPVAEVLRSLAAAPLGSFVAAFVLYLASQLASALRWRLLALGLGLPMTMAAATRYYFVGMFFGAFGPGLIGGDVVRAVYLSRVGGLARAASAVAMDRYVGFVWLAVFASAALLIIGTFSLPSRLYWLAHVLASLALGSWLLVPRIARTSFFSIRLQRWLGVGSEAWWSDRRARSRAAAMSILVHALQAGAAVVLLRAVGSSTSWSYCLVFHPLVAMLSSLPISVAGLGVRESGFVYFLAALEGTPRVEANAFAAAWLAVLVAAASVGGLAFVFSREALPRTDLAERQPGGSQLPSSS